MSAFIKRIFLFLSVVLICNSIINLFSEINGDERYNYRKNYLLENIQNYNTLFFGTSRTLRHTVPSYFDELNRKEHVLTNSFNLGSPGNRSLETYSAYEKFLQSYSERNVHNIKYVFVEIHDLGKISMKNLSTKKGYYWVGMDNFLFIGKYLYASPESFLAKCNKLMTYTFAFLLHNFGFNFVELSKIDFRKDYFLGNHKDGYISLEDEVNITDDRKELILDLRQKFLADTAAVTKASRKIQQQFNKSYDLNAFNEMHLEKLTKLYSASQEAGIRLFFVIPPRLANYKDVLVLANQLPNKSIIELANPSKYPDLYAAENTYDNGHLNKIGAALFTSSLSEKFVSDVSKQ